MIINITRDSVCSGGGHVDLAVSVDGGATRIISATTDDLRQSLTMFEREQLIIGLVKLALQGLTRAQVNTKFTTGITVTL